MLVELAAEPDVVPVALSLLEADALPVRLLLEIALVCDEPLVVDEDTLLVCNSPAVIVTEIHASAKSVPVAVAVVVELLAAVSVR